MNIWKDWKAKLESACSFMLQYSKITVCSILSEFIFRILLGPGYIGCLTEAKVLNVDTPLDFESILDLTFFIKVVSSHHVVLSTHLLVATSHR